MTTKDAAVAYAMSDMAPTDEHPAGVIKWPEDRGGCGQAHTVTLDSEGHPRVECALCAPELVAHHYGFAAHPAGVPLTPDERSEVEISKRQGEVSYNMAMKALGQTVGQMIQGTHNPVQQKMTAKDMLAALDEDELVKFRQMLAGPPADKPAAKAPAAPAAKPRPVKAP